MPERVFSGIGGGVLVRRKFMSIFRPAKLTANLNLRSSEAE